MMLAIIGSELWVRFYGVIALAILGSVWVSFLGPPLAGVLRTDLLTVLILTAGWLIMAIGLFFLRKWAAISWLFLFVIYSSCLISNTSWGKPELALINQIRVLFALGITLFPAITIAAAWTKLTWKGRWYL